MVYRKILAFHRWQSVKLYICGSGMIDNKHDFVWSRIKFAKIWVCNNKITKLYVLHTYRSQLHFCYCVSLYMSFNNINSVVLIIFTMHATNDLACVVSCYRYVYLLLYFFIFIFDRMSLMSHNYYIR